MSGLTKLDDALAIIQSEISPLDQGEIVELEIALGRAVFAGVKAPYSLPAFENTGVDGYAFRYTAQNTFKIVGASFAGDPFRSGLAEGAAVRIATGAVLPEGADTVVMQEDCEVNDDRLIIKKLPVKGANIRRKGADVQAGAEVLKTGQILQPQHIAMLGALGLKDVLVFKKIRLAIISTGQELKEQGDRLETGQVIDTNSLMLKQMAGMCADVTILDPLPDDKDKTYAALRAASENYDMIVTTGGVSVGDRDFVHTALKDLGQTYFWKLAIRPGKPLIFGRIGQCLMVGLPGNPVSSFVTFLLIVKPILSALTGGAADLPPAFDVPLARAFKKDALLRSFPRARLDMMDGKLCAEVYKDQSSNLFSSLTDADGFLDLPEDEGDQSENALVRFRPLKGWL